MDTPSKFRVPGKLNSFIVSVINCNPSSVHLIYSQRYGPPQTSKRAFRIEIKAEEHEQTHSPVPFRSAILEEFKKFCEKYINYGDRGYDLHTCDIYESDVNCWIRVDHELRSFLYSCIQSKIKSIEIVVYGRCQYHCYCKSCRLLKIMPKSLLNLSDCKDVYLATRWYTKSL